MLTEDAVTFFKSKSKLAAALGISPAAVSQWGVRVPQLRQYQLQTLSGGELKVSSTKQDAALAA
ncbi:MULTISPECIES: Cro/CI family transcriptional regulator [Pseudomonas]|uniref:Cro/CI family transcriptional regulator n=1 Tax=Pseudomonas TaxID=286 RepID=UPI000D9450D5|nr:MULTISPECIES: Cro/CI family transcriptional regulator [Pseudomonas]MDP9526133.1 Cro/CI family transcriptional regulator [Pseudomonas protegens]PYY88536.1 Cro/Cl family transcriptional regulator [Pseudomonas sp. TKO30]PYY91396.1 Cro/Cl family transcriptional regulator [Pseudomonas sp. TKO29]PYY94051.1 Cro/Cl family transcriptional regulator [Pseudomonas sp. TKO26]PYZ00765.1 Cro/Cl family transcriptional regulator [Pseudomonas sp. TKO14]